MFSVIFATALAFPIFLFGLIVRRMIREGHIGRLRGSTTPRKYDDVFFQLEEFPAVPTNIDEVTPFYYSNLGNLVVGPLFPGVNMELPSSPNIQPNNPSPRF